MSWVPLHKAGSVQILQKLAVLQTKLTELATKQKYNNLKMKVSMLHASKEKGSDDGTKPTGN